MAERSETAARMEWGECFLEPVPVPRGLAAEVRSVTGVVLPGWTTRLASVPWVPRAFARIIERSTAHVPTVLSDLIGLVVSRDNSCRYCYGATHALLRVLGFDEARIDRMERDVHLAQLTRAEEAALEFARRVAHANPRPTAAELEELARVGFTRPAIAEIAYVAAFQAFPNRVATLLALPTEPFLRWADHPVVRLLRPLLARRLRGRNAAPEGLPAHNQGPCDAVVTALEGSPKARVVREVVDDALASPVLPRRTKLLMLAVIGRALGCDRSEAEAGAGLAEEGLPAADLREVLAHLGSPRLDAREALLVPFARETVRYENAFIQRRTRELHDRIGTEALIEAVGIAALANSVARLSVLVEPC